MATEGWWQRSKVWKAVVSGAADPERVARALMSWGQGEARERVKGATLEQARLWAALWSGSTALSEALAGHPEWLAILTPENLQHPRRAQGLRREVTGWLDPALAASDGAGAFRQLREFKQRELCRIGTRDLGRLGDVAEVTRELSDLADVCLGAALSICGHGLVERLGQPYHQDAAGQWWPTGFVVLGLGKLGGQELNYSSDVDLMFVYSEEGQVFREAPRGKGARSGAGMTNHQFFKRLAEALVGEVTRASGAGMLYRVDLRLRPEGDAGPLVRSLASCENYYAQWGQTWERMMLIKARGVAGEAGLADEFLELIQPFRYPRHLSERALREMAAMKARLENEVVRSGELDRNVKLGRGGIREIEFTVQTAQMLNGGRLPFLQGAQTLPTLEKMVQYRLLSAEEASDLEQAYGFLRDVEHRLQMEQHLQTHTIPLEGPARERLARLMGFASHAEFEAARQRLARRVRQIYDRQLKVEGAPAADPWPRDIQAQGDAWQKILAEHQFRDPAHAWRLLAEFVLGPGYVHVSPRTTELAWELVPKLLAMSAQQLRVEGCADFDPRRRVLSDPDRVLARLDSFIGRYGARAMLFETWTHHPSYFELLVLLFDRSEFLAETALRTPDLVDELVVSGRLNRSKTAQETLADLHYGLKDRDQSVWLRRYHQAELMRIGLRDILDLADYEQSMLELTHLADACLAYALEVVLRRHRIKRAPFAIVGLGKLGGQEINFGSDLDLVFVAPSGTKNLPQLQRLGAEVMELLSARTEQGMVFVTDARLRPDGEKGLLVNTLEAFEDYYRQRAQLWEIQALSRTRPIAGAEETGQRFQDLAGVLTNFTEVNVANNFRMPGQGRAGGGGAGAGRGSKATCGLTAFRADWKRQIAAMRLRIEKERTPAGQEALAIKTGAGGLMDAEFIAQALCLGHGWQEANTLRALERMRDEKVLPAEASLSLIDHYCKLRRVEGILRRWSVEGETELPVEPAPYYRVSVRCGFRTSELFRQAVASWRGEIRRVYDLVFEEACSGG